MTFKDEIDANGDCFWRDAREERQLDIINTCVEKITKLEQKIKDLEDQTNTR